MRIQYASDLHLEFSDNWHFIKNNPLRPVGDILVLAGDIGYLGDDNYSKHPFWDWASDHFEQVVACMGNHEFYKYYDLASLPDGYCLEVRKNVRSYYNAVVNIGDTDLIVSTLWSHIPLAEAAYTERVVSDFHRILYNGEILTFADFNREHEKCLQFIKDSVSESRAKVKVVVTHHVPSFRMQCQKFVDSKCNGAFTSELENYIKISGIDLWIYGHSHYNVDVQIGKTLCVSNQLGYVFNNEHISFDGSKTIEIF